MCIRDREKKIADYCLEFLQKNEKAKAREIAEYYKLSYDTVQRTLNRLVNRGLVIKLSRGLYALKTEAEQKPTIVKGNPEDIPF